VWVQSSILLCSIEQEHGACRSRRMARRMFAWPRDRRVSGWDRPFHRGSVKRDAAWSDRRNPPVPRSCAVLPNTYKTALLGDAKAAQRRFLPFPRQGEQCRNGPLEWASKEP
jgi:hypothetical protein